MERESGTWTAGDDELARQLASAKARAEEADRAEPRAVRVSYDRNDARVVLELRNGCSFRFPATLVEGLARASEDEIERVSMSNHGDAIAWEHLDIHLSVTGLLTGVFGTRRWMAEIGRRGGLSRSGAKAASSRENGRKGGRPRRGRAKSGPVTT